MTPAQWTLLQTAFESAVNASARERAERIETFNDAHPELAAELGALLDADLNHDDDLMAPVAAVATILSEEQADPWLGRTLGPWTLRKRLAQGGMGAVFLADRSDETYSQTAAVKLMATQLVGSDADRRFQAERQILASLNHPFIANLIDGGTTDEGVPYLVMDYVDGCPIDQHSNEKGLGVNDRLTLFCKVCDTVDHAHRNLVVHRDLKPSNILVDQRGDPRLLDFGIAKLLDTAALGHGEAITRLDHRVMTPEYASPEQVRGTAVTVATDVYSLGVVLYRLLTGQSPYGTTRKSGHEIEHAVIEHTPDRPSHAIRATGSADAMLRQFGLSAPRLQRRLNGDLDNIILKALQKEPARRYPSAAALADDLRRYLAGEPVHARGDGWLYVTSKFAKRHAWPLSLAAVVVIGVATQTGFYTQKLKAERDRANMAAAQSRQVAGFLANLFDSASPHTNKGVTPTAVDLLEIGVSDIDMLTNQPRVQAELKRIMGNSFLGLGEVERARALLTDALATKTAASANALDLAEAHHNLSEAHRHFGDLKDAERELRTALEIREQTLPPDNELLHFTLARLGVVLFDQGRVPEGIDVEQRALDAMIAAGRGETPAAIDIRGNLANALDRVGRTQEAGALHVETVALSERIDGPLDPNTLIRIANLGLWLNRQGEYEASRARFAESLRRSAEVWPASNDINAFFQGGLGSALLHLGRLDEALAAYARSERITRTGLGKTSPRYLKRLRGLANVLLHRGDLDRAAVLLKEGRSLLPEDTTQWNRDSVLVLVLSGRLALAQGDAAQALTWLTRPEAQRARLSVRDRLALKRDRGRALTAAGRFDDARMLLTDALTEIEQTLAPGHVETASYVSALIELGLASGNRALGAQAAQRLWAQWVDDGNWQSALALGHYARALSQSDPVGAATVARDILPVLTDTLGSDDRRVRAVSKLLATP
ncbi:MAG: tetratricopeptide repeat protein [Pseudomonadota bacterium]